MQSHGDVTFDKTCQTHFVSDGLINQYLGYEGLSCLIYVGGVEGSFYQSTLAIKGPIIGAVKAILK